MPSRAEPWGLALNEAMCAGCAVIVSNEVIAGDDLVIHGSNGLIYEAGNILSLTDALYQLLCYEKLINEIGKKSLEIISKWSFGEDIKGIRRALGKAAKNLHEV
jgi:glycosyltransferase involved in cell wall biosynthesis